MLNYFGILQTKIPLETLKERDAKYRQSGIESYWILKNKDAYHLDDYKGFEDDLEIPYVDSFFSNEPGCENPNQSYFYLPEDVIAVGLDVEKRLLNCNDDKTVSLNEWINSILNGKYQSNLLKIREEYQYYANLRKIAKPILEEVDNSQERIFSLIHELKRQYAIFMNNPPENSRYIKENFNICYNLKKEMTKFFFGRVLSPKLGWKWIKSEYSFPTVHVLHLKTADQLYEIEQLYKESVVFIDRFEKQLSDLTSEIQSNIRAEKRSDVSEKTRNEVLKGIADSAPQITPPSESLPHQPVHARTKFFKEDKKPTEELVKFEANLDLPTNWLTSSDGHRYQIIPGLPVSMILNVAQEFEKKGYGRIIRK